MLNLNRDSFSEVTLDETFYDEFWKGFRDYLHEENSPLKPKERLYSVFKGNDYRYTYTGISFGHFYDHHSPSVAYWNDTL